MKRICFLVIVAAVLASCQYISVFPTQGYNAGFPRSIELDHKGTEQAVSSSDCLMPQSMSILSEGESIPFERDSVVYRYDWLQLVLCQEEKVIKVSASANNDENPRQLSVRGMCLDHGFVITISQKGLVLAPGESQIISYL